MKQLFVKRDSSVVKLPDGTWMDWSMYGPDYIDAKITYNDFRRYGNHCLALGFAGSAVLSATVAIGIYIYNRHKFLVSDSLIFRNKE